MEILRYQLKAVTHFWQGPLLGPMWLRLGGSGEVTLIMGTLGSASFYKYLLNKYLLFYR